MIFAAHNTFSEIDPELGTRHHPPTGEADPAAAVLDHYVRQAVGKGSFQDFCSCEQVFLVRQKKLAWTKKTCQGQENLIKLDHGSKGTTFDGAGTIYIIYTYIYTLLAMADIAIENGNL